MSLLDDVSLMITPNGVAEDVLFGVLPTPTIGETLTINPTFDTSINIGTAGSGWQDDSTGGSSASFSGGGGKLLSDGSGTVRLVAMTSADASAVVVSGTTYKLTYDVIENNGVPANKFSYYNGSATVQISETVGSYELYYTASGTVFQFQLSDSGMDDGDYIILDNVYLKEYTSADMDFTRATTATRSAYSVDIVTNGNFTSDSDWDKLNGSTISGGVGNVVANGNLSTTGSNWSLHQENVFLPLTTYQVQFRARQTSGAGAFQVGYSYGYVFNQVITNGWEDYSVYVTTVSTAGWNDLSLGGAVIGNTFEISNISVKELLIEDVPRNLIKYSQELLNSFWLEKDLEELTQSSTAAPYGRGFGYTITPNTTNTSHYLNYTYAEVSTDIGVEVTFSVFAKPNGYNFLQICPSSGFANRFQNFELTGNGTIGTGNVNDATIEKIGDWFRCSVTETSILVNTRFLLMPSETALASRNPAYAGNGEDGVLVWGVQVEVGSQATTYIPTTDRLNVPRIDYTGGGCPHILAEPQRTNLVTNSVTGNYGNAPGSSTQVTAPDGTNTAVKPVPNAVADRYEETIAAGTYATDTKLTYSWYRKRISTPSDTSYTGDLDVTGLENATISSATTQIETDVNAFDRFSVTFNITDGSLESKLRLYFGNVIGVGNSSVAYWGHQLEVATYATSLIPTSGIPVTRNADTFTRTGIADLINSAEGVLYAEIAALSDDLSYREIALSDGTNTNRVEIRFDNSSNRIRAYVRNASGSVTIMYDVTDILDFHKVAFKYKSGDFALWVDGTERATSTTAFVTTGLNRLALDSGDGTEIFYGKVRNLQVYKTALSDTQLDDLTS